MVDSVMSMMSLDPKRYFSLAAKEKRRSGTWRKIWRGLRLHRRSARHLFFGSQGHEVAEVIDASAAAVIFVIDFEGGGEFIRAGHSGSPERPDIFFLDPFANTNEHGVYPTTILITVLI